MPPARSPEDAAMLQPHESGDATIFLCLRDFSTVRNILPPDAVKILTGSRARIVVLCPDPGNAFLREYLNAPNIVLERLDVAAIEQALRGNALAEWFRQIRNFTYGQTTLKTHGTRFYHLEIFRDEILSRANTLFGNIYFRSIPPLALLASRSKALRKLIVSTETRLFPFSAHRALYEKYRPCTLVVPSLGYAQDPYLMREAHTFGARVLSIVRSWDNTTTKGYSGCMPDRVFAWNDLMRDEAIRYHDIEPDTIEVTGIPHWDGYFQPVEMRSREKFFADYGLDPGKKIVYYAMTNPKNFHYNFPIMRVLLEAIRSGRIADPAQLLVRVHPGYDLSNRRRSATQKEFESEMGALKENYGDVLKFSHQEKLQIGDLEILSHENQTSLKEIFSYSDVHINVYSTQMIEAAIFDLPIITIGWLPLRSTALPINVFEKFNHVSRIIACDGVTTTRNEDDLITAINADLKSPGRKADGRRRIKEQETSAWAGQAGRHMATRMLEVAREWAGASDV